MEIIRIKIGEASQHFEHHWSSRKINKVKCRKTGGLRNSRSIKLSTQEPDIVTRTERKSIFKGTTINQLIDEVNILSTEFDG